VALGLIAAPDIPEKIATELASELPDLLRARVDSGVAWYVPVAVDPLTGSERDATEILDDLPLILTHGWPNTIVGYTGLVSPLTGPRVHWAAHDLLVGDIRRFFRRFR